MKRTHEAAPLFSKAWFRNRNQVSPAFELFVRTRCNTVMHVMHVVHSLKAVHTCYYGTKLMHLLQCNRKYKKQLTLMSHPKQKHIDT